MTEGRLEIPAAAVEAVVRRHFPGEPQSATHAESLGHLTWRTEADLEAAYPHLLAAFKERLLSDEALEAGVKAVLDSCGSPNYWDGLEGEEKDELRREARLTIEAALASIDAGEGTDRG